MYEPGTVVAGKYRIERMLGRGGMGVVFAAEHLELRAPVALKFLGERYIGRNDIVERFLREARACAALKSDHVCRVSDVGRLDNGVPYIVMELLVGRDLFKVLKAAGGTVEPAIAADYVAQACDAIMEAHSAGIVHRDLKPGNLFLTQRRDGSAFVKVLDFGVAKAQHSEQDHSITSSEAVLGSPSYMAPEQLRAARNADARSDIWSLGVILHQLVSGKPPFEGETIADLAIRAATEPLPPLVGAPPEYAAIVARCLEKSPDMRFQSAADLAAALAPFRARETFTPLTPRAGTPLPIVEHHTMPLDSSALEPNATTLRTAASEVALTSQATLPRWFYAAGAAVAITIGVGLGLFYGRDRSPEPATPATAPATNSSVTLPIVTPATPPAPIAAPPVAPPEVAPPPKPADVAVQEEPEPEQEAKVEPTPTAKPIRRTTKPKPKTKPKSKEQLGASRI